MTTLPFIQRFLQFFGIYASGIALLWGVKYALGLSDYLIPPPAELFKIAASDGPRDFLAAGNTMLVAVAGHFVAVLLATIVAIIGRSASLVGNLTRMAAFNLQAYPVVAIAPIIFLFLGDGLASRLLIASLICYFPLLLSFIGIFSQPVDEVEHFFRSTRRLTTALELKIRTFENLDKLVTVIVGSGTTAMVGTIVAEFLAATQGVGYVIRKALYQSNLAKILIALFLIGLFSSIYLSLLEGSGRLLKKRITGT